MGHDIKPLALSVTIFIMLAAIGSPDFAGASALGFTCSTPADDYSIISQPFSKPYVRLSGTITPTKFLDAEYPSSAAVGVTSEDGKSHAFIRVKRARSNDINMAVIYELVRDGRTSETSLGITEFKKRLTFLYEFDPAKGGAITINGGKQTLVQGLPNKGRISTACNSGIFGMSLHFDESDQPFQPFEPYWSNP